MRTIQVWAIGLAAVVGLAACGRGAEPPRPTESLVPEIVGVVVRWDWVDCVPGRYTLDSGQEIVISAIGDGATRCSGRLYTPTPRLSDTELSVSHGHAEPGQETTEGDLLLYGHHADGEAWYAAARPRNDPDCPFEMSGGAWADGDSIHLASGLVLPRAEGFVVDPDNVEDPFPLRGADTICVDATGAVLSVPHLPPLLAAFAAS